MIRIVRYISISLTGLLTVFSLIQNVPGFAVFLSVLMFILWLALSTKLPPVHLLMLPGFSIFVILGFFYGNSPLIQLCLFVLILSTWEIDSLYLHTKGIINKADEIRLLIPLLLLELISAVLIILIRLISGAITYSIGFWPLTAAALLLILILKKLFKFPQN